MCYLGGKQAGTCRVIAGRVGGVGEGGEWGGRGGAWARSVAAGQPQEHVEEGEGEDGGIDDGEGKGVRREAASGRGLCGGRSS